MQSAIQYNNISPNVVRGKQRIVELNPTGNFNGNITAGQNVTWQIGGPQCLLDPYDTYLKVTISFANNTTLANDPLIVNKIVQLDNSAQSLFSQLLLLNGNDELERIQEYDSLSAFLNDVDFSPQDRSVREFEGIGGQNISSIPNALQTAYTTPITNDGTTKGVRTWYPENYIAAYVDLNSRIAPIGLVATQFKNPAVYTANNQNTIGYYNYPVNHSLINHRYAFSVTGTSADVGVLFSSGTDKTESFNDFTAQPTGITNDPALYGPFKFFDPSFGSQSMEPFFSQTVLQRYMNNGFIKTDFITAATYCVPLNSGYIGRLMHPNNYKYIPLWLVPNLRLEMLFAQHAFFTSWFTTNQGARAYQVTDIKLMTTMLEPSPDIIDTINAQARVGIKIPSQTFTMGPRQSIPQNAIPPTIQISQSFDSLRNIFFFFIPNDYTANAACRKQYRLSMGINSIQVRVGNDYYPQLAIQGNGGTNLGPINNYEYLRYLYACFGMHCTPKDCAINSHNFAINGRVFDPTLTSGPLTDNNQLSLWEENKVIGKAVYGIPLDKLNMDSSTLGGISTSGLHHTELMLGYSSTRTFPRNATMLIFCHHDTCLEIVRDNPDVEPRVRVLK